MKGAEKSHNGSQPDPESIPIHTQMAESMRRARLGADVGAALTSSLPLAAQLRACAEAIVAHVDAAFARIWVLDVERNELELLASAGMYTHLDGPHGRVPVGSLKIGRIAQERKPYSTNDVLDDPWVGDKEWASRERMVAFAGYPLVSGDTLVGVAAMFSRAPIGNEALSALSSISDSIAVGIERKRIDDERLRLIVREQTALAEAERQRKRLETLFLQAPAAICVVRGTDHVFELANPRYVQLVGADDLIGKRMTDVLPAAEAHVVPLLDQVYRTGEPVDGNEYLVPFERGGTVENCFFNFVYQPIYDADGQVEGVAVLAFEVTAQVRARKEAEQLTRALKVSNQDLDQFAYVASHDLKAPLRGIANLAQWIEEELADKLDDETQNHMRLWDPLESTCRHASLSIL